MPHKKVAPAPPQLVIAWGQYLHWSHLHFEHFLALDEDVEPARLWGVVCHWLAAEYVVLEGWRELDTADARIEKLFEPRRESRRLVGVSQTIISDSASWR